MAANSSVDNGDMTGLSEAMDSNDDAQCTLRFLMVNGESFKLTQSINSTVEDLKRKIIEEKPEELIKFLQSSTPSFQSGPSKEDELRILHLGKFLDDTKYLRDYNFETGKEKLTTVHIAVKIATVGTEEVKDKKVNKGSGCCAVM